MVFYITFLKALATCLITNSHYTGVYPTDLIANGGLVGDILFFAVSGYCLCNVKKSFLPWYGKRLYRVYVPVIIITLIYMLLGFYDVTVKTAFSWFIYPTHYHFLASIVLLYIPFYIVMKLKWFQQHLPYVMLVIAGVWIVLYLTIFDRSFYHIDDVYSWFIRFLFFESMLLGAYFKINDKKYRNSNKWYSYVGLVLSFVGYFASKLAFSKYENLAQFQFINQLLIFALLFFTFLTFSGLDNKLCCLPMWLKKTISFLSGLTLEIYLVQFVILDLLRDVAFFPINWVLLTTAIIVSAVALNLLCKVFYKLVDVIVAKIKKTKKA